MICSGCEDGFHDRCLDGQMHSPEKPWAIECDCASQEHAYKHKPINVVKIPDCRHWFEGYQCIYCRIDQDTTKAI